LFLCCLVETFWLRMYLSRVETAFFFFLNTRFLCIFECPVGRDSVVGIATRHELDDLRIESRLRRGFPHSSRSAWGPPGSCTMGTGSFTGVKRPERGIDHTPPFSTEVKDRVKLYIYYSSGPYTACSRVKKKILMSCLWGIFQRMVQFEVLYVLKPY
jgi:hypothetical protein